jgi:hypothetical protein
VLWALPFIVVGGRVPCWRTTAVGVVGWAFSLASSRVGGPHEEGSTNRGMVPSVCAVALLGVVRRVLRWSQRPASRCCCVMLPSHLLCDVAVTLVVRRLRVTRRHSTTSWVRRDLEVPGWYLKGFDGCVYMRWGCFCEHVN